MKRMLEVKNEMLEKLRVEVAELSLVLNNDKSKSIRTIEVNNEYQQKFKLFISGGVQETEIDKLRFKKGIRKGI